MKRIGVSPNIADGVEGEGDQRPTRKRFLKWGSKLRSLFERRDDPQKRINKLAKKKCYYKDEDGEWVAKINGREKPVPGFKLDVEFPEIAEKYEQAVEKYFKKGENRDGRIREMLLEDTKSSFKGALYMGLTGSSDAFGPWKRIDEVDADNLVSNLSSAEDDDFDRAAWLLSITGYHDFFDEFGKFFKAANEDEKSFENYKKTLPKKIKFVNRVLDRAEQEGRSREEFLDDPRNTKIMSDVLGLFNDECEKDGFIDIVARFGSNGDDIDIAALGKCAPGVLEHGGGEFLDDCLEIISAVGHDVATTDGRKNGRSVYWALSKYVRENGLDSRSSEAFSRIKEGLIAGDKDLSGFGEDISTTSEGEFGGLEIYTIMCYSKTMEPENIDLLVRIHNSIPTTDFGKREKNREDAEKLQGRFFRNRDFIHEERPGVHEIISALVDYYDSKDDPEELEAKKEALRSVLEQYNYQISPDGGIEKLLDMAPYDYEVAGRERVIDVLRRLKENTEPVPLSVPETKYPNVNEALKKIDPLLNEKTGEIKVGIREVGEAVAAMNRVLLDEQGKQTIFPSTISAVAYLDKMSAYALRGIDKKEWGELIFDDNFKEMVRFSELTSSTGYDEEDFEKFFKTLRSMASQGFGEEQVDSDKIEEAYKMLGDRMSANMEKLGKKYAGDPRTKRFVGAIWSGNLVHELQKLAAPEGTAGY